MIAAHSVSGINIGNTGTSGNVVANNFIGTDAASDKGLGNVNGVLFYGDSNGGPTHNTIGPGNVISGNSYVGVVIYNPGTSDNVVAGDLIGTNVGGTAPLPNANGVILSGGVADNTIGGTTAGAADVISGNTTDGVEITGSGTIGNVVAGNDIGTNAAGTLALPNGAGVAIVGGASANTVGGTSTALRNVISGNTADGVDITGTGTSDNVVAGNYAGTPASGSAALGNGGSGVSLTAEGKSNNTIGGGTATGGRANVLSGNHKNGQFPRDLYINGSGTNFNVVVGNYISSTNAAGTAAVANDNSGILISSGADGNTIGGTAAVDRNIVSGNTRSAASFSTSRATTGNLAEGNWTGLNAAGTLARSPIGRHRVHRTAASSGNSA